MAWDVSAGVDWRVVVVAAVGGCVTAVVVVVVGGVVLAVVGDSVIVVVVVVVVGLVLYGSASVDEVDTVKVPTELLVVGEVVGGVFVDAVAVGEVLGATPPPPHAPSSAATATLAAATVDRMPTSGRPRVPDLVTIEL